MNVLTTTAGPRPDTGAAPLPVPWRQMLWVIWRQHRALLIGILVAFVAAVAGIVIEGLKIHHDYAILAACHPAASPACAQLSNGFNTDWHIGNGIRIALLAAPVLLALFGGPSLVARELENGTYRYAWTQGIGRIRWTVAKLVFLGSVVTVAALLVTPLFTWLFVPFLSTQDLRLLDWAVFTSHGTVYAAWMLAAFCLGAFLGTLIRRTLPAMAATLGLFAALVAATWLLVRSVPVTTFWPVQVFESGWLLLSSAALAAGTLWLVRHHTA
jgi:ABC-type transport system involved in multi-copper enzyme maturation permease subunit